MQVDELEEAAGRVGKVVGKLSRDIKTWPVLGWLKDMVDAFKKTMPLITDLRNPSMRQRHWALLMVSCGLHTSHWALLMVSCGLHTSQWALLMVRIVGCTQASGSCSW